MTTQEVIERAVLMGGCTSACWADLFIKKEKSGDNIDCCMSKLKLLNKWIEILNGYYCDIYTLELDESCLDEETAIELASKIQLLIKS